MQRASFRQYTLPLGLDGGDMLLHRLSLSAKILQVRPEPVQPLLAGAEPPLERAVATYRPTTATFTHLFIVAFTLALVATVATTVATAVTRFLVTVMVFLATAARTWAMM
jgi:hypothetical protein